MSSTTSSGESSVDSQSTRCFRSTGVSHNRSGRREHPDLIDEASISYLELAYPPKWISRAGARLSIGPGNHTIDGLDGPTASIEQIRCLHVPLRARAVLDRKARHGERLAEAGYPLQHGWHVRRIARLAAEGRLDEEWELNSHLAGVLTAPDGRNVPLERDPTLRELVASLLLDRDRLPRSNGTRTSVTLAGGMSARQPGGPIHEFPLPAEPLPASGERCAPEIGDQIQHEHFHRYLFALRFCEGKDVLDVACGEGYGSALLGAVARTVVGVDASPEAIAHAETQYGSEQVTFVQADARALPLEPSSVDTVVCFETLEHLSDHDGLLEELARVLRPDGVLLLSTPDRDAYLPGEASNPYHLREVDEPELADLLARHFANVRLGGQSAGSSSAIVPRGGAQEAPTYFDRLDGNRFESSPEPVGPVYLIALASNAELPALGPSVLLDRQHLPALHAAYRDELTRVWAEVARRDEVVSQLEASVAQGRADAARLRAEAAESRAGAELLERAVGEAEARNAKLERARDRARRELEATYASASWRLTAPLRAAKRGAQSASERAPGRPGPNPPRGAPPAGRGRGHVEGAAESRPAAVRRRIGPAARAPGRVDRPRGRALGGADRRRPERRAPHVPTARLDPDADLRDASRRPRARRRIRAGPDVRALGARDRRRRLLVGRAARVPEPSPSTGSRIGVTLRPANSGVSAATNAALELAAGEFVGMLDHDDELHPAALAEIVRALERRPVAGRGLHRPGVRRAGRSASDALLKPDWSPRLFWGVMYVGHLLVVRRSVALALGGFDSAFDNVQDFEFMLRLSEQTGRIAHVPQVLYKWRRIPGSVAFHGDEKSEIDELQAAAVTAHFNRAGIPAVAHTHARHAHRTTIVPRKREGATVTSCSTDRTPARESSRWTPCRCEATAGSTWSSSRRERLDSVASSLRTDYLASMHSGLVPGADDWLDHLLLYADLPDVAAVAPLIVDRRGRVEQAGLILGADSEWEPAMRGWDPAEDGYAGSLSCARDVSAVSGAAALISRAKLTELGGFSGAFATGELAWVELSVRAAAAGLRNV